jgi:hemerythrin-like metal-binding protein
MLSAIWTNRFSVGNGKIDSAHREIVNMIFRIAYLIAEREETALAENFRLLEANICAYFELEESMAGAINHDFTPHKLAHQSLLIDLQCVRKNLEEKNGKWSDGDGKAFSVFWAKSFFQHIKDSEMLMQAFPNTDHYDLHPA